MVDWAVIKLISVSKKNPQFRQGLGLRIIYDFAPWNQEASPSSFREWNQMAAFWKKLYFCALLDNDSTVSKMNNQDFWHSIHSIIDEGFTANGLSKLESYAEQFITQRLVYKRFSSAEQYGCSKGSSTHVIASLLAGAETAADRGISQELTFKEECELGKAQESLIETWARKVNLLERPPRWECDTLKGRKHFCGGLRY